jgi:hypothetical protein
LPPRPCTPSAYRALMRPGASDHPLRCYRSGHGRYPSLSPSMIWRSLPRSRRCRRCHHCG